MNFTEARNLRRSNIVTTADLGLPPLPDTGAKTLLNARVKAFLESLPVLSFADLRLDSLECPFCIEPYQNSPHSERPVRLPCSHVMGRDCLKKWLNSSGANANNNACPTCRAILFERDDELDDDSEDETPPPVSQSAAPREQLPEQLGDLRRNVRSYQSGPENTRTQGQYEEIRDALFAFEATADIYSAAEANVLRLELEHTRITGEYEMLRRRREHNRESERPDRSNDRVSGLLARRRARESPTYRVRDRIPERPDPREDALRPVLVREGGRYDRTQSQMQTNQDLGTLPERLSPGYPPPRALGRSRMGSNETVWNRNGRDRSQDGGRERDPREDALRAVHITGRLRAEAAARRTRAGYESMSSTRMRDDGSGRMNSRSRE